MFWERDGSMWIDDEIARVSRDLSRCEIASKEYQSAMSMLERLYKMKEEDKSDSSFRNNLVVVAANLLGIIMIIRHEHVNVLMSRALNLILSPRIKV